MDRKLQRDEDKKMLGGVAAGLAEYFDIDVTLVRVIFVLMAVLGLSGALLYLILWIVVPANSIFGPYGTMAGGYQSFGSVPPPEAMPFGQTTMPPRRSKGRVITGAVLVLLGLYFLLDQFFYLPEWFHISKLWPVILIVIGAMILGKSSKRNTFKGFNEEKETGAAKESNPIGDDQSGN